MAGGGTGGHLYPALAIADEIRKLSPVSEFLFVGTKGKIEERVVPQRGYRFRRIWISGFHRRPTLGNLLFPVKLVVSLVQSFFLIKEFQPDVVIGTGGYVCGPVLSVASWLRIPTVVHESNSYPGFTTRLLAGRVSKVFIAYEVTKRWLKRADRVELVGSPTREVLGSVSSDDGRKFFSLDPRQRTILVFGGSLGATSINTAILTMIDEFVATGIQLIWQTGQADFDRVQKAVRGKKIGWVGPFIENMEYAYAAAEVVVCRSGALTIAELTRVGLPAILIPYPHAAADHQTLNAQTLVAAGAALVVKDAEIPQHLKTEILGLLADQRRRNTMATESKHLGRPEAGKQIAQKALELIR